MNYFTVKETKFRDVVKVKMFCCLTKAIYPQDKILAMHITSKSITILVKNHQITRPGSKSSKS